MSPGQALSFLDPCVAFPPDPFVEGGRPFIRFHFPTGRLWQGPAYFPAITQLGALNVQRPGGGQDGEAVCSFIIRRGAIPLRPFSPAGTLGPVASWT